MIEELKKSINSTLYERATSPLFGTLLISWLIWNWKIVYLTIFISEETLSTNKIDYIISNYFDWQTLLLYPSISAFFLIAIFPFISNGAYWVYLLFHRWKIDKKHEIQNEQLITLEQSIKLRKELAEQEKLFEQAYSSKNDEISNLKAYINELEKNINSTELESNNIKRESSNSESDIVSDLASKVQANSYLHKHLTSVATYINKGYAVPANTDNDAIGFLISNNLIENIKPDLFAFTPLGKKVYKKILDSAL